MIIPEVIDVDHHEYLFNRVLALGLTIDFVLLRQANDKPDIETPNAKAISKKMGEIGKKYSKEFFKDNSIFNKLKK